MTTENVAPCRNCNGTEWVCENHRDRPWDGSEVGCECGAGAPCGACRLDLASAGYVDGPLSALRKIAALGDDQSINGNVTYEDAETAIRIAHAAIAEAEGR